MPLIYQHQINGTTQLGVWQITEPEVFFLQRVPVQRTITHPHKRLQHLAGRYLLLQLEPDFPFDLVKIAATRKPFLENERYHFSISHCGDFAAVIISRDQRVGIDIETISEKIRHIVPKFLTEEERALLSATWIAKDATLFWSIKESIYKWYGEGLVDFKKHIRIISSEENNETVLTHCSFLKNAAVSLTLQSRFIGNHCLSWTIHNVPSELL